MDAATFAKSLKEICWHFERTPPKRETQDQWFSKIENIPTEAMTWIKGKITEMDIFPKNYPQVCWALFHRWLEANPDKRAKEHKPGCPECENGYLTVGRIDPDLKRPYDLTFKCGYCNPKGYPLSMPAKTRQQLIDAGFCKPICRISFRYLEGFPEMDYVENNRPLPVPKFKAMSTVGDIVTKLPATKH